MTETTVISAIGEDLCQACKFNAFDRHCPHCNRNVCQICFKDTHCLACESEYLYEVTETLAEIFHLAFCQWSQKAKLIEFKELWVDYSSLSESDKQKSRDWAKLGLGVVLEQGKFVKRDKNAT